MILLSLLCFFISNLYYVFCILNFCSWYLLVYYAIFCPKLNEGFHNDNKKRILNISGFQICQVSAYAIVALNMHECVWEQCVNKLFWQCKGSEYVWSKFYRALNMPPFLNMPGLRMWPGYEYARVIYDAEYSWITLAMP